MQGPGRRSQIAVVAPTHTPPTSDELIETYRLSGRPEDFERIVRRFAALVHSECRRVTGNGHDAEDASQLTFLALAMQIKSGTNIRQLSSWLQQVSRRQAIKIVRSRGRRKRREDAARKSELHHSNGHEQIDADAIAGMVRDAIDQLPEAYRLPLILHYFGGMKLERIAVELKCKRQAIATRLHRGRKMLGVQLEKRGLKMEDAALGALLMTLIPAEVISRLARNAGRMTLTAQAASVSSSTAALPMVISQTLRAVASGAVRRPLAVAALAVTIACGGTGMGWAIHGGLIDFHPLRDMNLQQRIEQMLPRPKIVPRADATPAKATKNDAPRPVTVVVVPEKRVKTDETIVSTTVAQGTQSSGIRIPELSGNPHPSATVATGVSAHEEHTASTSVPVAPGAPMLVSAPLDVPRSLDVDHSLVLGADTHLDLDQLRIGTQPDARGFVTQSGGIVNAEQLTIGDAGQGRYLLHDGQLSAGSIVLGAQAGATGELNVAGGQLFLHGGGGSGGDGIVVGAAGSGRLTLGTDTVPGEIHATGNARMPLTITQLPGSHGVVQGWGTIDSAGGDLINNGQVIGDGHGHTRELDLTSFDSVSGSSSSSSSSSSGSSGGGGGGGSSGKSTGASSAKGPSIASSANTTSATTSTLAGTEYSYSVGGPSYLTVASSNGGGPNGPGNAAGLNTDSSSSSASGTLSGTTTTVTTSSPTSPSSPGWYVQGGGQVALPPIAIAAGSGTYTWGDSNDKSKLDLVNSLRLGVHDQPTATELAISLRTVALKDPLDITLPGQTSVVGLWQFDHASTFDPSSVDVTVRYDDNATATLIPGAEALQMFAYEDGSWRPASDLSRDSWNDLISGKFGGSFDYLAVGVPWNVDAVLNPSASTSLNGVTPTPEAATTCLVLAGGVWAALRRRRRALA